MTTLCQFLTHAPRQARRARFVEHRFAFRGECVAESSGSWQVSCVGPGWHPQIGRLQPVRDVWLLTRRNLTKVPRVRAVADYLFEVFRRACNRSNAD